MIDEQARRAALPRKLSFPPILILGGLVLAVLALPVASGAASLHETAGGRSAQTAQPSRLQVGQELFDGSALVSPSGRYRLALQSDGNLVLYWEGQPLWNTGTRGDAPDHLVMQNDGNLVLYNSAGTAIWSTGTCCH